MKKVFLFAALAMCIAMYSCKSGASSNNPSEVFIAFVDAMGAKDFAKAKTYCTPESQMMFGVLESFGKNIGTKEFDKYDKNKIDIGTAKIDGDNATVPIKEKGKEETVNFPMKKVGGIWKVAFDMQSMMKMGIDKMKEKGMDLNDTLGIKEKMDEFKNMNLDSLMKDMNMNMNDTAQ